MTDTKLIILDKDRTICTSFSDKEFINSIDDQILIPGVAEKCAQLRAEGHTLAVASNQGAVAFGIMTFVEASKIVQHAANLIQAIDFRLCPFHPQGKGGWQADNHYDRKPNPGMILDLADAYGFALPQVVFIGDRPEDQGAAKNAGVQFVWAWDFFTESGFWGQQQ